MLYKQYIISAFYRSAPLNIVNKNVVVKFSNLRAFHTTLPLCKVTGISVKLSVGKEQSTVKPKWSFLEHNGPMFPPKYEPLPERVRFFYNGKPMKLSVAAEEIACFYSRMLDHEFTTKSTFNENFFTDWQQSMTPKERKIIVKLDNCNFHEIHKYLKEVAEANKNRSKEEKLVIKAKRGEIIKKFGFCTIDGNIEKVGNFCIEPPGLFRGRGENPKMGCVKRRIIPEDVIINCSKDSVYPMSPAGHKWMEIRHDTSTAWLACWKEDIQNKMKYVMLNASSQISHQNEIDKYEMARNLDKCINKIRKIYKKDWTSDVVMIRQRATALYFIDVLALRCGHDKADDQTDTVGCCSLRVEHISLHANLNGKKNVVVFDFLGKDSIRYQNEVAVDRQVFENLLLFKKNKKDGDELFDQLNPKSLNEHLQELMAGLTAKVFRTYNASVTLQMQLDELTDSNMSLPEKLLAYNRANRTVALKCNHQRAVPKNHEKSMENMSVKISTKRKQLTELENDLKTIPVTAKGFERKQKRLEKLQEHIKILEFRASNQNENKAVALGTSKLNYLDPRISVAWCKKYKVPVEKIYNESQRSRFSWAIDSTEPSFSFK